MVQFGFVLSFLPQNVKQNAVKYQRVLADHQVPSESLLSTELG